MGRIIRGQVLAGTGPDRQGTGLDRKTIETVFRQVQATGMGVNHDLTHPPATRAFNFRLDETSKGELTITADIEVLDEAIFEKMGGFSISLTGATIRCGDAQEPLLQILVNPVHFDVDELCNDIQSLNLAGHIVDVTERIEKADLLTTAIIVIVVNALAEVSKAFLAAAGSDLYATLKKRRRRDHSQGLTQIQFHIKRPIPSMLVLDPAVTADEFAQLRDLDITGMLPPEIPPQRLTRLIGQVAPGPVVSLTFAVLDDGAWVRLSGESPYV